MNLIELAAGPVRFPVELRPALLVFLAAALVAFTAAFVAFAGAFLMFALVALVGALVAFGIGIVAFASAFFALTGADVILAAALCAFAAAFPLPFRLSVPLLFPHLAARAARTLVGKLVVFIEEQGRLFDLFVVRLDDVVEPLADRHAGPARGRARGLARFRP